VPNDPTTPRNPTEPNQELSRNGTTAGDGSVVHPFYSEEVDEVHSFVDEAVTDPEEIARVQAEILAWKRGQRPAPPAN